MEAASKKSPGFWTYCLSGLFAALLLVGGLDYAGKNILFANPAHTQWQAESQEITSRTERARLWTETHRQSITQREFEEAIAGLRSPWNQQDSGLQRLAYAIRSSEANAIHARTKALLYLLGNEDFREKWLTCENGNCSYKDEIAILNQPTRLQRALSGDAAALVRVNTMPRDIQRIPAVRAEPPRYLTIPTWWRGLEAGVFSFLFALGFCVTGGIIRSRQPKEESYWEGNRHETRKLEPASPSPLKTYPDSILGGALFLSMFPGMLVIHLLRFLVLDLRQVTRTALERIKKKRKPFRDEYERLRSLLQELRERAVGHENKQLTEQIDQTLERVRVAETQDQLKAIAGPLEEIQLELSSKAEAEDVVARRTAP